MRCKRPLALPRQPTAAPQGCLGVPLRSTPRHPLRLVLPCTGGSRPPSSPACSCRCLFLTGWVLRRTASRQPRCAPASYHPVCIFTLLAGFARLIVPPLPGVAPLGFPPPGGGNLFPPSVPAGGIGRSRRACARLRLGHRAASLSAGQSGRPRLRQRLTSQHGPARGSAASLQRRSVSRAIRQKKASQKPARCKHSKARRPTNHRPPRLAGHHQSTTGAHRAREEKTSNHAHLRSAYHLNSTEKSLSAWSVITVQNMAYCAYRRSGHSDAGTQYRKKPKRL